MVAQGKGPANLAAAARCTARFPQDRVNAGGRRSLSMLTQRHLPTTDAGALVRSAAGGDQQAWSALVERYSRLVWSIARSHRLSADDAGEVSQTTWLRLAEHIDRLQDPSKVGGWLATTARHESLRVLRGAGRQIPMGDDMPEPVSPAAALDEGLLRSERDSMLWQAFSRLPARDQALLRLLVSDPMPSYEEIAAALGMPVGSVGPTRARCLERLRREAEVVELAAE
jgi:RNA polymerase sigma factor (sigma-70 family)